MPCDCDRDERENHYGDCALFKRKQILQPSRLELIQVLDLAFEYLDGVDDSIELCLEGKEVLNAIRKLKGLDLV